VRVDFNHARGVDLSHLSIDVLVDIDAGRAVEHRLAHVGDSHVVGQEQIVVMSTPGQQPQRGQSWKELLHCLKQI